MTQTTRAFTVLGVIVGIVVLAVTQFRTKSDPPETMDAKVAAPHEERPPLDEISSENDSPLDGHSRMLAVLARLREEAFQNSKYDGEGELRRLRKKLSEKEKNKRLYVDIRLQIGRVLLQLGRTDKALKELLPLYDIAKSQASPYASPISFLLGLTYLTVAEDQNCVSNHTSESCLLPIRGSGIHANKEPAQKAMVYFGETLKIEEDVRAMWLLNISAMAAGEYPGGVPTEYRIMPGAFESQEPFPRFFNVAMPSGLDKTSLCGGSIVDDLDGDGLLDVMVSSWGPADQLSAHINDGQGMFRETTEEAGITGIYGGINLNQADYDNDGDVDVFVMRGAWLFENGSHPNSLLQNDGSGRFVDVTFDAGIGKDLYPTQTAAWADYDNDGNLDLVVGNEFKPIQLFRNNGNGTFTDMAADAGLTVIHFTKTVMWGDFDNDRYPDIYVSNLDAANQLFHNQGDGTFIDIAVESGVTEPSMSFPGWFWDFNNDGNLDIYVASYGLHSNIRHVASSYLGRPHEAMPDRLYQGDGHGGFLDVAREQNLTRPTAPMGSNFGDLDNDGFPDFYLGTGYPDIEQVMPNLMFRNREGRGFSDVTTAGGFGHLQKGHGVAFADLDNDGDQDVFIEMGGAFPSDAFMNALFENPGFSNNWIKVKLNGVISNRSAIGARIRCSISEDGKRRNVYKWVNSGGSFGANPLRQEIGLGKAGKIDTLEVYWPTSDTTQRFDDVAVNQFIEITEGLDAFRTVPLKRFDFETMAHHNGPTLESVQ